MNRLSAQRLRLYAPPDAVDLESSGLVGPDGQVRALVLALGQPADWATLAPVWQGVQADLGWPAPAIAVNGVDAFELWFSLAEPVAASDAAALLLGLQQRYLPGLKPERMRRWPTADAAPWTAPLIPAQRAPDRWSAFVAPDLAAVFGGDDPSLDFQPGDDAQAELLSRLASVALADWRAALAQLRPGAPVAEPLQAVAVPTPTQTPALANGMAPADFSGPYQDPRRFLLDVMNAPGVSLALRIDAAKALLHSGA